MEIHFSGFGPGFISPEQMEAQRQQQEAMLRQMVEDKRCEVCGKVYLINDTLSYCPHKKECVDGMRGTDCEDWEPILIN